MASFPGIVAPANGIVTPAMEDAVNGVSTVAPRKGATYGVFPPVIIKSQRMSPLQTYLARLETLRANPHATDELSLRPALDELFQTLSPKNIQFVGEGKKQAAGRPDFTFSRAPLGDAFGYVEAEKIAADLGDLKGHAKHQNDAFAKDFDNFLLTNHLDFRLYDGGSPVESVVLPEKPAQLTLVHEANFQRLWDRFTGADVPAPKTAPELAVLLARRARALRFNIAESLKSPDSPLHRDLDAFRRLLLPDLDAADFANLYAETLAYGLFAARCQHVGPGRFSLAAADRSLRRTPLLRTLYRLFEEKIDPKLEWILDAMASILNGAAIDDIRAYFENRAGRPDPMIDFYEPFLAQYDARARRARGVYYTPEPVVSFIVRGVHGLLQERFGMELGLAGGAKILDPATGTGSFLFAVIEEMHREVGASNWKSFVRDRKPLDHVFGFELMVAPYTIAHLKLALQMEGLGTPLGAQERVQIFLTNTLDDARRQTEATFESAIADEVNLAADVKDQSKILVVLGNPPYAGKSSNITKWEVEGVQGEGTILRDGKKQRFVSRVDRYEFNKVGAQIETYRNVDGAPMGERNSKYLSDDYVKFLAFAQMRIEKSGEGIVAFITPHGYLENPTFRGMRQSFLKTFTTIYVLDLHGNANKKEVSSNGSVDENVFAIKQGVAIMIAVKEKGKSGCEVLHAEEWGSYDEKKAILFKNDIATMEWNGANPVSPMYFFTPRDDTLLPEYQRGWSIADIFPFNSPGVKTHRDAVAIASTTDELKKQAAGYLKVSVADVDESKIALSDYRPFDRRFCYYGKDVSDRPRPDLLENVFGHDNISLATSRQQANAGFHHVFAARHPANDCFVSNVSREANYVFPLYLFISQKKATKKQSGTLVDLDLTGAGLSKRANISEDYLKSLVASGVSSPAPEDVFGFIYAVLHAPTYRARYGAFLKTDFPRVPLPTSLAVFETLARAGRELVALHTLDVGAAPVLKTARHGLSEGSDVVERVRFDGATGRLHISDAQWFEGVEAATASFKVGGYVVADKWLSDRRGRTLSFDERRLFPQILVALDETRRVMDDIDAVFLEHF